MKRIIDIRRLSKETSQKVSGFLRVVSVSKKLTFIWALAFITIVGSASLLISGFEAHVINVTAQIEQNLCDARSKGYWANHEGCHKGTGSSVWVAEINDLSSHFSGVFGAFSGSDICEALWIPNCSSGHSIEGKRCRAKAHTLADELNIVSNRLDLNALIAGAFDGNRAFDNLRLTAFSTIEEALIPIESIIFDTSSTKKNLRDAAYVARRIYTFYEKQNPFAPNCVFDPDDVPRCLAIHGDIFIKNKNNADVTNDTTSSSNTGGNSAGGGDIDTGNASSTAETTNIVNTNITNLCGCEEDTGSSTASTLTSTSSAEFLALTENATSTPPDITEEEENYNGADYEDMATSTMPVLSEESDLKSSDFSEEMASSTPEVLNDTSSSEEETGGEEGIADDDEVVQDDAAEKNITDADSPIEAAEPELGDFSSETPETNTVVDTTDDSVPDAPPVEPSDVPPLESDSGGGDGSDAIVKEDTEEVPVE